MNEELREHLTKEFKGAPHTPANDALFEEMLGNLEDRCQELMADGVEREEAISRAIREMGDIRPLIDWRMPSGQSVGGQSGAAPKQENAPERHKGRPFVPAEKLRSMKKRDGFWIAIAVMLYILCVVPVMFGDKLVFLMFVMIGAATAILCVLHGQEKYTDNSGNSYSAEQIEADRRTASVLVALGVFCFIVSVVPVAMIESVWGVALMFGVVALGVGLEIYATHLKPSKYREKWGGAPVESAPLPRKRHMGGWIAAFCVIALLGVACLVCSLADVNISIGPSRFYGAELEYTGNGEVMDEAVKELEVFWTSGSVKVLPTESEEHIRLEATYADGRSLAENDTIYWGTKNGKLCVTDEKDAVRLFHFRIRARNRKVLTVYVPEGKNVWNEIKIGAASADVELSGLHVERTLDIDIASGDVTLTGITANKLNYDGASGNLLVDSACSFTVVDVDTASGDLQILGGAERIDIDSASGDITLAPVGVCKKIKIDTASGDITLDVAYMTNGFSVRSSTAEKKNFHSDFSLTVENGRYYYGDRVGEIDISMASGKVYLKNSRPAE